MAGSIKRDELIETALKLFSQFGFHAVGIDRIIDEAGVAKKTLYNHFRSKDDLILAVLRRNDEQFRNDFVRSLESRASTPKGRMLVVFDIAEEWFNSDQYYGCMFINAIAEFSHRSEAIDNICKEYKRTIRDYLAGLAREAGASDSMELAEQLSLLLEGAIVTAQVSEKSDCAKRAKDMADRFINEACY